MSASTIRLLSAVRVIVAAWNAHGTRDAATTAATALEDAGLLQSPESAAELDKTLEDLTGARLSLWEEEQENARLRLALKSAQRGRRELRELVRQMRDALSGYDCPPPGETPMQLVTRVSIAWSEAERRIAELEAERHSTNDALAEMTVAQRASSRPAILDLPPDRQTRRLVAGLRAAAVEAGEQS